MFEVRSPGPLRGAAAGNRLQVTAGGEAGSGPPALPAACGMLAHLEEDDKERRDFGVQKTHPRNLKHADRRAPQCLMGAQEVWRRTRDF